MSRVLEDLLELLTLEPIEENLFRGRSQDLGFRQLFGGQVLGQALSAASRTVEPERRVHSLHGYFLRPGDASLPVVYTVDRVRDGGSFTTRRVVAIQKGQPIFTVMASFHAEEAGYSHQARMPDVKGPEGIPTEIELLSQHAQRFPERLREKFLGEKPIEMRPVTHVDWFAPEKREPLKYVWFRAHGALPEDPQVHRYLLAYASDFNLITTAMQPHGVTVAQRNIQVASLDHALWFHGELRMNEWLLYAMESPWAGSGRGLSRGHIFTREGKLVASVAQEGLMRLRTDTP